MAGMTPDGFEEKKLPEIKQELESAVRSVFGGDATLLPDSPEGQIISILSIAYAEQWEQLHNAYSAFNPLAATNQTLDDLVLLNGLTRLPPLPSVVLLSITGVDNTVIPAGSIVKHVTSGAEFLTNVAVEIGVGFATGTAQVLSSARVNGATIAIANTLTIIDTPVNGWNTVINNTDAIPGRLKDTDADLRARRDISLALSGSSSLESIIGSVGNLVGVVEVAGIENFTDAIDVNGLNPHSFEITVLGGEDASVAQTIWIKKPVGIEAFGNTLVPVNDIYGNLHDISFTRPTQVPIWINANITFFGSVPDDAASVIADNIILYVTGNLIAGVKVGVGDDVVNSRFYTPINLSYANSTINLLEMSIDDLTYNTNDIPIIHNQLAVFDLARINIVVG